jgi:hypothetical protein
MSLLTLKFKIKSKMSFGKQRSGRSLTQREKLAMIGLCEEMQIENPTMLMKEICSKAKIEVRKF